MNRAEFAARTLAYFGLADEPEPEDVVPEFDPAAGASVRPAKQTRARIRPTLHDVLMSEAGFETEYHEARTRRRDARRALLRSSPVLVIRALVLLAAAVFLLDLLGVVDFVPKGWSAFLVVAGLTEVVLRVGRALLVRLLRVLPFEWESIEDRPEPAAGAASGHRGWSAP